MTISNHVTIRAPRPLQRIKRITLTSAATSSKFACATLLVAALLFTSPAHSAQSGESTHVELENGDQLTGHVKSLDQDAVVFNSALAHSPLEIKAESIRKITFPEPATNTPFHTERLTLANNDIIPCKVLSMDDQQVHISTWYAGKFSIPRTNILALQFGLSKQKIIFNGTAEPSDWTSVKGNWSYRDSSYTCSGLGSIAQKLDLPEKVKFTFDYAWIDTPNFAFRFCADTDAAKTKQGTYELTFNSAGMQINRYLDTKQRSATIASISDIKPRSIANQSINIDIRVDRREGLVTLYVDSKLIGTWPDPFSSAQGNHIIFNNRTSKKNSLTIRNIQVTEINEGLVPRHQAKISHSKSDVLVDTEGERYSGKLKSIKETAKNKRSVIIAGAHSDTPLQVPLRRISGLIFAQPEDRPDFPAPHLAAILQNGGRITLLNTKLQNGELTSIHPILGPCTLSPKALLHIEQSRSSTGTEKSKSE